MKPIVISHRGLHAVHPENSLPAFRAAVEAGVAWVECDVQRSFDDFPIIIHDDTLDRTTSGAGRVDRHLAEQLMQLRLRNGSGRPTDVRLPVLPRDRTALSGFWAKLLVEIKSPDAPRLVQRTALAMRAAGFEWMIQSFDPANLHHAARFAPRVPQALLIEHGDDLLAAVTGDWRALHVAAALVDASLVNRLHARGRTIGAWTVNDKSDLRRMIALGVDRIITDEPELAMSLLKDERGEP
ncbi:glycerophosphodiester phosphodiesterase family protein [soil metagenome]